MQDLRGSEQAGGKFSKNEDIFDNEWDYIIIDEAHEGTQTTLGEKVLKELSKSDNAKVLHLSGTPFNIMGDFDDKEIYTWDYVMEQSAKADWAKNYFGDTNPYEELPRLNIFTYNLNKIITGYEDFEDKAFNFREFFRTWSESERGHKRAIPEGATIGDFVHKDDVMSFLNLITKGDENSNYPYSTEEYRNFFRHSLWMVPGVKEAKALSALLKQHPIFGVGFNIVNVAGEGDVEENTKDALDAVNNAIGDNPDDTYSITISCGRLTTGVSVQAWTSVLMLSGSYSTKAAAYMQTIFRVQTPANINGRIKSECYVFDFAPDRTLKIIAETSKISAKAGTTSDDDRAVMGEFINFCPVISIDGTNMQPYDVDGMLQQLKRVYTDKVVRNGFDDIHIYNDKLLQLDNLELLEFEDLKKIIGASKQQKKSDDIDINNQGLTKEEYEEIKRLKKKPKKELSEEDKKRIEAAAQKTKNKQTAISILRGISIRIPLMVYGADIPFDQEITIDNFTSLIDPLSWEEFMPKGVTKQKFNYFARYFDPDIFVAAGRKIRNQARSADSLHPTDRVKRIAEIFSTFKNPDKETVLTPWRVVNMHLGDCLGGWNFYDSDYDGQLDEPRFIDQGDVTTDTLANTSAHILEINSKTGLYPLYVVYSIYRKRCEEYDETKFTEEVERELWFKTVAENIFVICMTPMAKQITKRTLIGYNTSQVNARYFEDLLNQITNKKDSFIKIATNGKKYCSTNTERDMKFNAIVGNPPYQIMDGGAQASSKPVYNLFVEVAKSIKPSYLSMIMPSRWYAGGKGLDEFRDNMLNDCRISTLHDFLNPDQVFPNTNIRGGVCYFLWDDSYNNEESLTKVVTHQSKMQPIPVSRSLRTEHSDTFIRHGIAISIINKISEQGLNSIASYVSSAKAFGYRTYFINDDKFRATNDGLVQPILCYGRANKKGWVEYSEITAHQDWIDRWKVYTPESNNIGTELNDDNQNSFVGEPNTICTETFLVIGADLHLNQYSSNSLSKYLQCRFGRFLHSLAKISQHGTSKTYQFVPLQNFTQTSDIDWSKPIKEIDSQLYKKYNLTPDEITFIESTIKPME